MTIEPNSNKTNAAGVVTDSDLRASDLKEEDGWLFRERPGLPVECVERAPTASADSRPLYHSRQNYPST